MSLFKQPRGGLDPLLLWRHSLCVAIASRKLGDLLLPQAVEDLYVAGLLHDLGISILVHYFSDEYVKILRRADSSRRSLWQVELSCLGTTHAEVGYALASRWRLTGLVCECIRHHEGDARAVPKAVPHLRAALEIVRFADGWAESRGLGLVSDKQVDEVQRDFPGVSEQDLESILRGTAAELQEKESDLLAEASFAQEAPQVP
jgi:HD-like signal output (HDOD) protein